MNIGWVEVALVVGVALIVFGPKKIPQLGSAFGKTLRGFKEELQGTETAEVQTQLDSSKPEPKIIDR